MTTITFKGKALHTAGALPKVGSPAPDFAVTKTDLSEMTLKDCLGKKTILSLFPSVDTGPCAASVRHFNQKASQHDNVLILCISADLPFAFKRFCAAEHIENVVPASIFRHPEFGKNYGVTITEGPLAGLLSRAVLILDPTGKVIYTQHVPELTDEPDYASVLAALS